MKRVLRIVALLIVFGGLYAGFLFWQKKQAETTPELTPVTAESPSAISPAGMAPTSSSTATATALSPPDLTVQADGLSKAVATLTMEKGDVVKIRFFTNDAPNTVKRITDLIASGFYSGIVVHRVEPGFVVQAGDPTATGAGGSGVKLKAEFNSRKHEPGILSMARTSDPNSADSQFFIMTGTAPQLDGQYSIFGKVIEGFANVQKIQRGDKIKSFTIQ